MEKKINDVILIYMNFSISLCILCLKNINKIVLLNLMFYVYESKLFEKLVNLDCN